MPKDRSTQTHKSGSRDQPGPGQHPDRSDKMGDFRVYVHARHIVQTDKDQGAVLSVRCATNAGLRINICTLVLSCPAGLHRKRDGDRRAADGPTRSSSAQTAVNGRQDGAWGMRQTGQPDSPAARREEKE